MNKKISGIINLIIPTLVLGAVTGILTSIIVNIYKYAAKHIIHFSEKAYCYISSEPVWALAVLVLMAVVAFVMSIVYKKHPDLKGGGIPASIAALRGISKIKWLVDLVGVFVLSLVSFLFGIPLGNEGPSVQMGCAVGNGVSKLWSKNHRAWERYSMTGGSCAGFSVATGAAVSGVVFAIEEAHRRISPMILAAATASVFFASVTTEILAPILGISRSLFPEMELPVLDLKSIWIPVSVAVFLGLFAVVFLKLYSMLNHFYNKKLSKIPAMYKIFAVFAVTLIVGMFSANCISTGHELALHMLDESMPLVTLVIILFVRSMLTLSAGSNGITGGTFLPLLAIGITAAGIVANIAINVFGADVSCYRIILVLGLVGCISAMMKMPLTAVVFAAEALGCVNNMAYVILVALISYIITEVFSAKSINDTVVEQREEKLLESIDSVVELSMTVKERSFAAGREISDILWPYGLVVLSVHHESAHGGSVLSVGDAVSIRCATPDESVLIAELEDILGTQ